MTDTHHDDDVPRLPLLAASFVVVLVIAAALVIVWRLTDHVRGSVSLSPADPSWFLATREDMSGLEGQPFVSETAAERARRQAAQRLGAYGWIDRTRGIVHIPIDVATRLYLQRHEAARKSP